MTVRRTLPVQLAHLYLLTLIPPLLHVEASDDIGRPPLLILSNSTPNISPVLVHRLNTSKTELRQTAPGPTSLLASSTALAVEHHVAANHSATVVNNDTTHGSRKTGNLTDPVGCGGPDVKRSWLFRGRIAASLNTRECAASIALEPAVGLVSNSDAPPGSKHKQQSASSQVPQAAEDTQQIHSEPKQETQRTDSQPAKSAPQVDSELVKPAVAPPPLNSPIPVQGQTVPANGSPITMNNQIVRISSGSIYVGSTAIPIPQAKAPQSQRQPIVAGTLTFHPASPSQLPQAAPALAIVGGLTFSAAQSEPSVEPNAAKDGSQAQPVVVGGNTYAPVQSTPQARIAQGQANTQNQEDSESPNSDDKSENTVVNKAAQADSSSIVIGGITYTPVTANPTPSPQRERIFSYGGTALTQGGKVVMVSGTLIPLGSSCVVVGTLCLPFGSGNRSNGTLTAEGETFTPLDSTAVVIDGTTISIGGSAITEHGTRISLASSGIVIGSSTLAYATPIANTAAVSTASGTFSTSVLPSGGAIPMAMPSATGGVGSSAASTETMTPGAIVVWFGISISLSQMLGS